jgi:hypothetical protein
VLALPVTAGSLVTANCYRFALNATRIVAWYSIILSLRAITNQLGQREVRMLSLSFTAFAAVIVKVRTHIIWLAVIASFFMPLVSLAKARRRKSRSFRQCRQWLSCSGATAGCLTK